MRGLAAKFAASAALVGLLGGCSLTPDFVKPTVEAPAAWDTTRQGAGLWPSADWWKSFRSTELEGLIAQAMANSFDLRAAVARIRQAQAQAEIAGAGLYPFVDLSGSESRSKSASAIGANPNNRNNPVQTTYQAAFNASYQVDLFGGNRASANSGAARLEAAQYDRQTVTITLVADVATTYFQIVAIRERRALAEESLSNAQSILDLLTVRQGAGAVSDLEVAQQRSAVASQRASLPALALAEKQSLDALAVLLGRAPQGFDVQARAFDQIALPAVISGQPMDLLERRPDIRKAELDLMASNFDIGEARAARLPGLDLSYTYGTTARRLAGLFDPGTFFFSLAASVAAPLFEGGRLEGAEKLTRAQFEELALTYQKTILNAFADVEDSLAGVQQNSEQYGYSREAYEQAREAYRLADLRFRVGTQDFLTVLESQRSVFQTADSLAQTSLGRYTAAVNLYKALGGGWDGTTGAPVVGVATP